MLISKEEHKHIIDGSSDFFKYVGLYYYSLRLCLYDYLSELETKTVKELYLNNETSMALVMLRAKYIEIYEKENITYV